MLFTVDELDKILKQSGIKYTCEGDAATGAKRTVEFRTVDTQELQKMIDSDKDIVGIIIQASQEIKWKLGKRYIFCKFHGDFGRFSFASCQLAYCHFEGAVLRNCHFVNSRIDASCFEKATLQAVSFAGAEISDSNFSEAVFIHCVTSGELRALNTKFSGCSFAKCHIQNGNLLRCVFERCEFAKARFEDVNLDGAKFFFGSIELADFRGSRVSDDTRFNTISNVEQCIMDRYMMESLREYGGLTRGQRMNMQIIDPIAILRNSFSGYWTTFHAAALATFLGPYLIFLASKGLQGMSGKCILNCITIWKAFGEYLYTGGRFNGKISPSFFLFFILFFYNLARGILLWKTKALELQEEISGLSARFSLTGKWHAFYLIVKYGFFVNLLLVLYHTYCFMQLEISHNYFP